METGKELRDEGIKKSLEHADEKIENWSKSAYDFLKEFAKSNKQFLVEDVRLASAGVVDEPPSKRAWGGVIVMARKNGVVKKIGYKEVSNPLAHRTPATLWETV